MNRKTLIVLSVLILTAFACKAASLPDTATTAQPTAIPVVAATVIPPSLPEGDAMAQQNALVALYNQVTPGVVAIRAFSDSGGGLGSGFVYDNRGYIVTNYHVVEGAQELEVDFTSGYKTFGTVVGTDLDSDLAVIKVDAPAEELHPLALGDSKQLQVGQTVVAIGNPFGLNGTMTVGIISALGRTLDSANTTPEGNAFTAGDIIQTDAAINPGNSGGPLFNLKGEVIGINRAIKTTNFTDSGDPLNSGIGFAISINIVKRVTPVIIDKGRYDYPYMGIQSISDLTLFEIDALDLPRTTGAYVIAVAKGGPAAKAGIRAGTKDTQIEGLKSGGDLIVAIDGQSILRFDELLSYLINEKSPGDTIVLTILRDGQQMDVSITLGKRP
jgi:S1-C subfamily serine protease